MHYKFDKLFKFKYITGGRVFRSGICILQRMPIRMEYQPIGHLHYSWQCNFHSIYLYCLAHQLSTDWPSWCLMTIQFSFLPLPLLLFGSPALHCWNTDESFGVHSFDCLYHFHLPSCSLSVASNQTSTRSLTKFSYTHWFSCDEWMVSNVMFILWQKRCKIGNKLEYLIAPEKDF